jgi:hypothetical protein
VQLEKAFAIKAPPEAIWRALERDVAAGDSERYEVLRSVPNELLELSVHLQGGVQALIGYRLIPREDHTEVVATMLPSGFRYKVFQIITLGRADTNYELLLVQGLANLKQEVEGPASA